MTLSPGTRLGPYDVIGPLGAGGMGEVYRARDARLGRDVALKILPDAFSLDAERLARFEREAHALASLNHPHIGAIYGIEQTAGAHALVLELVEGETLADRLAHGPLPVDEAVRIALQIAEALEAAHTQGIVHRDLKPANVKLTPAGSVKVLDFGLAKLGLPDGAAPASGSAPGLSMSPTLTSPAAMTGVGMLLGTAAYMAPEQARGKRVDRRADVWALGCVLFEMLAGRRPFEGSDVTELLASVIKAEPPWDALPAAAPPRVRAVLAKCLEKDPAQRLRDCGDVRLVLLGAFDTPPARRSRVRTVASLAAVAAAAAVMSAAAMWLLAPGREVATPPRTQFALTPPDGTRFAQYFALSPNGEYLAFTAADSAGAIGLWVHSFRTGESRHLESAGSFNNPLFWSPDSQRIGFVRTSRLSKVDIDGGPAETIVADAPGYDGGAWNADGIIVFAAQNGLLQVPASGGTPTPLTRVDDARKETTHSSPWFLPDGRHFLYARLSSEPANSGIYVGTVDTAPEAQSLDRLLSATSGATYVPDRDGGPGTLIFLRDRTAIAVRFDPDAREVAGDPRSIAEGVGSEGPIAMLSASASGTVAYRIGGATGGGRPLWVDRTGREVGALSATVRDATFPRVSPDGTRVALVVDGDVWVYHVDGRPPVRVTFEGGVFTPLWTPDGQRIVYESSRGLLSVMHADGRGGQPDTPFRAGHFHAWAWSPDGSRVIVSSYGNPETGVDLVHLAADGGASQPIVVTPEGDATGGAALSPDGRWLAYQTWVTGTSEIWVRPYEGEGPAVRISPDGGNEPVWARDGRELYYIERNRLMAVTVDTAGGFRAGVPTPLFEGFIRDSQPPSYDVAANGRFLIKKAEGGAPASPITVVVNWAPATPAN